MNIPNQISMFRIFLIPVFMIFMLIDFNWGEASFLGATIPVNHLIGAIIFIIASITDFIDGYYARKYNLVTNMGKFLDPLADKLLVSAALIILVQFGVAPAWVVILIISREFAVTGLRLILANTGEVVAANQLGKIKMWTQIIAISSLLLGNVFFEMFNFPFDMIMLYVCLFFTLWSGFDYFYLNRKVLLDSK
ncbi:MULTISPECIES: CDP-diacylglycerol--glycerol-3-phosphate 3-phosphatidyltransferase [unclassified Psychrobacillus]|uniref:CDP-diacylglycerol--glycerol-3-phosphate 3-phosphatidyltransferase n=1 Tax=unclassified Psychrobacillus TaxID=2636677 RepID=UPI001469CD1B|nr:MULTISPECIES: CDP-diacylglycerol--glycerol-3-phosphate 3-phosphatidyltransferase [unclassified Psychrobacillus]MCM3356864.1 CDP-diacylglycerol--glycerol-3-phosphate 3-phosphatidyltransferase [Psychrobacillus sp. MER TA 171]NME04904.1 CDP-diacylglycerol--glycerol-3-phosphate 3-phosphatidyltransferase [Psychrobacillus sp. BL-248-WT-3]